MSDYSWAVNPLKLQRALAGGGSEDQIKQRYISLGGKVVEDSVEAPEEPTVEEEIKEPTHVEDSVEAPETEETKTRKPRSHSK